MTAAKPIKIEWFAFYYGKFITKTMRLTTEGKGAYLMLICDYYAKGRPCPDDDDVLAAITGLSLEVWKSKHRKALEPFFEIHDGLWHHDVIRNDLRNVQRRYERTVNATKASLEARATKIPKRPKKQRNADVTLNVTGYVTEYVTGGTIEQQNNKKEPHHTSALRALPLPEDFRLSEEVIQQCYADGATDHDINSQFDRFLKFNETKVSDNWPATWARWWFQWKERQPAPVPSPKAKTRTAKRGTAIPLDWKPSPHAHELATEYGEDIVEIEAIFREYCKQEGKTYKDHDAAFNGFIRRQKNFRRGSGNGIRKNGSPERGSIQHALGLAISNLEREIEADSQVRQEAIRRLPGQ